LALTRAAAAAAALFVSALAHAEPADQKAWRRPDPEMLLVVDTSAGRIVVEMNPDLAPLAVARIKALARAGVYDGLLFHRVIEGFVDQTGNPNNHDGGGTSLPDLPPEFDARLPADAIAVAARPAGAIIGFIGALPVEASAHIYQDGRTRVWGLYCSGVVGMGRQASWDSANSEIFFMRNPARRLDHDYTVWGRALTGLDVIRKIKVGEPPKDPDLMIRVRVASDLPPQSRPDLYVMNERAPAFADMIAAARRAHGADFSPCDVTPPVRGQSR